MKFGLKIENVNLINEIFSMYKAIDQVIIYGSRAKNIHSRGSDIDLAIIDENLTFTELLEIEDKLDDLMLPYKVDLSQKRKISNPELLGHIERVGKVFYKKS